MISPARRSTRRLGMKVAESAGSPFALATGYFGVASVELRRGDYAAAIPTLERALEICRNQHVHNWSPAIGASLGYALRQCGPTIRRAHPRGAGHPPRPIECRSARATRCGSPISPTRTSTSASSERRSVRGRRPSSAPASTGSRATRPGPCSCWASVAARRRDLHRRRGREDLRARHRVGRRPRHAPVARLLPRGPGRRVRPLRPSRSAAPRRGRGRSESGRRSA